MSKTKREGGNLPVRMGLRGGKPLLIVSVIALCGKKGTRRKASSSLCCVKRDRRGGMHPPPCVVSKGTGRGGRCPPRCVASKGMGRGGRCPPRCAEWKERDEEDMFLLIVLCQKEKDKRTRREVPFLLCCIERNGRREVPSLLCWVE